MILVYLVLETRRFTAFDCHYFPENNVIFSRVSEPKHYSGAEKPSDRTGLCAEIPCWEQDSLWTESDETLGDRVIEDLRKSGMPVTVPINAVFTKRLSHAYPVYALDYDRNLAQIERHLDRIPNLIRFGRQAIFLHDNIHHALTMGYMAADCMEADGNWNRDRWRAATSQFHSFTVED